MVEHLTFNQVVVGSIPTGPTRSWCIVGRLFRAAEAIAAIFPGGSVTGAPKVRAMEILAELEPVARGVYCGALGWISPDGAARMNLPIRTLLWREAAGGPALDLHVGGGIALDSSPEAEAEECRIKGEALALAVARALAPAALR